MEDADGARGKGAQLVAEQRIHRWHRHPHLALRVMNDVAMATGSL